jgi:hypothetical protein
MAFDDRFADRPGRIRSVASTIDGRRKVSSRRILPLVETPWNKVHVAEVRNRVAETAIFVSAKVDERSNAGK